MSGSPGNQEFDALPCGLPYLSTAKHQHGQVPRSRSDASSWNVDPATEADFFDEEVRSRPSIPAENVWLVRRSGDRLQPLGTADEKIALVQAPSDEDGYWHGHPRGHRGAVDYPAPPELRKLKDDGTITKVEFTRMRRGDIP